MDFEYFNCETEEWERDPDFHPDERYEDGDFPEPYGVEWAKWFTAVDQDVAQYREEQSWEF